jgi:hypothetical protein
VKAVWSVVQSKWSRFRATVGAFTLRERIIAALIVITVSTASYLAYWAFFNQQGIWMGDLFFRKVSDNQYQASASRFPDIGSTVTVELEDYNKCHVIWEGYEWYGRAGDRHLFDEKGNIIPASQLPFWNKVPYVYEEEELHELYFLLILARMRADDVKPLGHAYPPVFLLLTFIFLLKFFFPDTAHRLHGMVSPDFAYPLDEEERQYNRFSSFITIVILVVMEIFSDMQSFLSNWV